MNKNTIILYRKNRRAASAARRRAKIIPKGQRPFGIKVSQSWRLASRENDPIRILRRVRRKILFARSEVSQACACGGTRRGAQRDPLSQKEQRSF